VIDEKGLNDAVGLVYMKVREKDSPTFISNKLDKPTYVAEVLTVWKLRDFIGSRLFEQPLV